MLACFECQSPPNFSCSCSGPLKFMCKHHITTHSLHSDFNFLYTSSLHNNFQLILSKCENQFKEVVKMQENLMLSYNQFMSAGRSVYLNADEKLEKAKKEISETISYLNEIKPANPYPYTNIFRFILEPQLMTEISLVKIVDNSKNLINKLESYLKVESITNFLLKIEQPSIFDEDFFKYEKEKAMIRENILKKYTKPNSQPPRLLTKMLHRNMNKRSLIPCIPKNPRDSSTVAKSIFPCLEYSEKIEHWHLHEMEDTSLIIDSFFIKMDRLKKIGFLSLKNFIKSENQLSRLYSSLQNKKSIKHVYLKSNLITSEYLGGLLHSFILYKEKLRTLNISNNFFSDEGCAVLNHYLPSFTGLRDLNISYNDIGDEGIRKMSFALSQVKNLEELNVKNNRLTARGIQFLLDAIRELPHLSFLNVTNNEGGDEGVLVVAGNLKYFKMLMVLYVEFNMMPETQIILLNSSFKHTKIYRCDKKPGILIQAPDFF